MFVARLVENKECMAFIEGFLNALAREPGGLHAVIAGDGPYRGPMRAAAAERGAEFGSYLDAARGAGTGYSRDDCSTESGGRPRGQAGRLKTPCAG